jgi:hypothetical protein
LKQVLILVKPKGGVTPGTITLATTMSQVTALTANTEAQQLFNAGMNRVYVLPTSSLSIASILNSASDFFTILVSSDFANSDVTGAAFGNFAGVIGVSSTDDTFLATQAVIPNRAAFHTTAGNLAQNMFFAFGMLLSNSLAWGNQQYIAMPLADDVTTLGQANTYFTQKINFVISDTEFGQRLGLFAVGGKAIVAPYVIRNLQIDMQSAALTYISANQPNYTLTQAALLEDELDKVMKQYIDDQEIADGDVQVTLEQDNFIASGEITIAEPKALWRIFGEMRQST